MKLTRNLKKHLLPVCLVLAFALLLGLTLNLYKPLKQLTQKKVPNPDNLLKFDSMVWTGDCTKDGLTYHMNEDGSWHIFGTSTKATGIFLTLERFSLETGKTYMLSSGMKHAGVKSYWLCLAGTDNNYYMGDVSPDYDSKPAERIYGAFEAKSGVTYHVDFIVPYAGAVIDEVVYPCLVEGTEAGDFYIYK